MGFIAEQPLMKCSFRHLNCSGTKVQNVSAARAGSHCMSHEGLARWEWDRELIYGHDEEDGGKGLNPSGGVEAAWDKQNNLCWRER